MDGLTEGRIVHFVMDSGPREGDHRPAIVVRVWDKTAGYVNLQVFTDSTNDGPENASGVVWKGSRSYSETKEPGTWHWIEKA
jgi:hypothetical protein